MSKPIVSHQFLISVIGWLGKADDGLLQRFCTTLFLENPVLARKVVDLISFADKTNKTRNKKQKEEDNE